MSTSETLPTKNEETYRGYVIKKSPKIQYGEFVFSMPTECIYHGADSPDHARELIDDILGPQEVSMPPSSPLSISGDTHKLEVLLFAVDDYRARLGRLVHEYPGIGKDVEMQRAIILEWQGIIATQIKDQRFDEETKD